MAAVMSAMTGMGRQQRFKARRTHLGSVHVQRLSLALHAQKEIAAPCTKKFSCLRETQGKHGKKIHAQTLVGDRGSVTTSQPHESCLPQRTSSALLGSRAGFVRHWNLSRNC